MNGITYFNRMVANIFDLYHEINTATLTGAIDVIVVDQPDGSFKCSPFHVRFGKLGVLRYREKTVDISINDEPQTITMKLGENGEAFFVEEIPENERKSQSESDDSSSKNDNIDQFTVDSNTIAGTNQFHSYSENNLLSKNINLEKGDQDLSNRRFTDGTITELRNVISEIGDLRVSNNDRSDENELELTTSGADDDFDDEISSISHSNTTSSGTVAATIGTSSGTSSGRKKKRRKTLTKKKKSGPDENVRTVPNQDSEKFFFSDTELNSNTRPSSPVQSDSELEVSQRKKSLAENDEDSWAWGQLPKVQPMNSTSGTDSGTSGPGGSSGSTVSASMNANSGGVNKNQNMCENESSSCGGDGSGDNNVDVATTSGPTKTTDKRSVLSGMFSFLRHSRKNSNEKNLGGLYLSDLDVNDVDPEIFDRYFPNRCRSISMTNDDCESGNGPSLPLSPTAELLQQTDDQELNEVENLEPILNNNNIMLSLCGWDEQPTEESFMKHLVEFKDFAKDPSLLESNQLVIRIMDKFYHWKVASPLIMSLLVFRKPLPASVIESLASDIPICDIKPDNKTGLKLNETESKSYFWWTWRRKTETNPSTQLDSTSKLLAVNSEDNLDKIETRFDQDADETNDSLAPLRTEAYVQEPKPNEEIKETDVLYDERNCRRTLRLSSQQIESLNLKPGRNKAVFSVTTAYQGTSRCKCFIYRWRYDDKIVVSDIDGTITKSDVLGHILPIMGKDWAQTGVAQLFTKIKNNGYKLLYLSSRAIGQSRGTRDYLKSIKQNELTLPEGPILLNPTSLIIAFQKEVIEKTPEKFKIQCLQDINALFPVDSHPFCAGYGNKVNDVWSYRSVNIPIEKIFTINHRGELKHELTQTFRSSYINMSMYVDELYPPLKDTAMDYSQFLYWRDPIPEINPKQIVQST